MARTLGTRRLVLTSALVIACSLVGCGGTAQPTGQQDAASATQADIDPRSRDLVQLLSDLVNSYESPSPEAMQVVTADLETIGENEPEDQNIAMSIANHWNSVYVDPNYSLRVYQGGEDAPELADAGIVDGPSHAFVVLGYELKDGAMTDELRGRCDAAAAAANTYPETIIVCTGGATGKNNPENHTEAGLMKQYFVEEKGIDESRIFIDEQAMTTAENAMNSMAIMQQQGVQTMTIVTSTYHQRWGQAVYHAASLVYGQQHGYSVNIVGDLSYSIAPSNPLYQKDDRIAVRQIAEILGVSPEAIETLPAIR